MKKKIIQFALPDIGAAEIEAVTKVLKSGWLTTGPKVVEFEQRFAAFHQLPAALAVSSATAAMHLAWLGLGIKPGDEVILPSYTFISCANTIVWMGAKPVFADIKKGTYLIDPAEIERKITSKTKAILVVHFGGQMAPMDQICQIARRHNLKVVEDCAHSLGATWQGKIAGSWGDCGTFSFYATKNLTTGEGGMVVTKSSKLAKAMVLWRLHGMDKDAYKRYSARGQWYYEIERPGYKYNMTDLEAALGLVQLKKIKQMNAKRTKIAQTYSRLLKDLPIGLPTVLAEAKSVWHLYPIQVKAGQRQPLITYLRKNNIIPSVHFIPIHLQPYYRKKFGYRKGDFPITEQTFDQEISLPLHPKLTLEDADYIGKVLTLFYKTGVK